MDAGGVLGQVVAGEGVGAGAAAAADGAELAGAAPSLQLFGIAEVAEELRPAVDIGQRPLAHVTANQGQETRRTDLPDMGDKGEPLAVVDAETGPV